MDFHSYEELILVLHLQKALRKCKMQCNSDPGKKLKKISPPLLNLQF